LLSVWCLAVWQIRVLSRSPVDWAIVKPRSPLFKPTPLS
jgi:hypothetical protein